jgi:hypothetical protein
MKGAQAPVSLNELLDRPLSLSFKAALVSFWLRYKRRNSFVLRSVSNARIKLPENNIESHPS